MFVLRVGASIQCVYGISSTIVCAVDAQTFLAKTTQTASSFTRLAVVVVFVVGVDVALACESVQCTHMVLYCRAMKCGATRRRAT